MSSPAAAPSPSTSSAPEESAPAESVRTRLIVAGLSVFVCAAVAVVLYVLPHGAGHNPANGPTPLATVNAALNGAAAVSLLVGFAAIRARRRAVHRAAMLTAFGLSSLFLVTYLLHHISVGSVRYGGTGLLRVVYLALLIPHVLLAAVVVPLALFTLLRAQAGRFAAHRWLARITLPIWLFVSISGVAVYAMLYHL